MATPRLFDDRRDAGRQLAATLNEYVGLPGVLVLGLARGGVPVASEVAHALGARLDVCIAHKLGVPGHEEFALGAIASGGTCVLHGETIRALGIPASVIERVRGAEERELARRDARYRGDRPPLDTRGSIVVLVDDGMATGATMQAAAEAIRSQGPLKIIVAVPVASRQACDALASVADACVCLAVPGDFVAVGTWYRDFGQTSDDEVRTLLDDAPREGSDGTGVTRPAYAPAAGRARARDPRA